jgi:hypothetical protein
MTGDTPYAELAAYGFDRDVNTAAGAEGGGAIMDVRNVPLGGPEIDGS